MEIGEVGKEVEVAVKEKEVDFYKKMVSELKA